MPAITLVALDMDGTLYDSRALVANCYRQALAELCLPWPPPAVETILAHIGKPYNLNFLNAETEESFYCSQLIYKAYQQVGIDLNTGLSIEQLPGTNAIIYPQEIWGECMHRLSRNGKLVAASNPPQ